MAAVSFTVDTSRFESAINRYSAFLINRKGMEDVAREQMKFAVRAIIDLTPFSTLAQGRQVVHDDLKRAVKPYGGEKGDFAGVKSDKLRQRLIQASRRGQYDAIQDIFAKLNAHGGFYSRFTMENFSPSLHHKMQNSRGRVVQDGFVVTPQVREWRQYLASLQGQIGRARGGWAASADALGLSLPGWVRRHSSGGSYHESREKSSITITMINRAVFIPDYKEKVALALRGRQAAMRNDIRRLHEGAKTHAGL